MDFDPNVYFNFWGFFLMEIMNIILDVLLIMEM